ncbi:MAG TPA: Stp1/IreP family PP2C-type Ser/Thr phosphatase [Elusimicrobiota bacterium]|nr:Stp1/IreP family PP2C-type Ser/Thr phosphatase [Elusimicrobiota bacterium]
MIRKLIAGITDPGKVRQNNEDNFFYDEQIGLLIVCDGMGGHASGEVASQMALDNIREQMGTALKTGRIPALGAKPPHLSDKAYLLASCVRFANEVIYGVSQGRQKDRGMGTTVVAVLIAEDKYIVAHVGDSRLYLFRNGKLKQVTQDHSLVAEQVAKGLMTEEEAEKSDIKNVLTRALGVGAETEVDVNEYPILDNDTLLLCTDGLTRMVPDREIEKRLQTLKDPMGMCHNLVSIANENGGRDNVTLIIANLRKEGFLKRLAGLFKKS